VFLFAKLIIATTSAVAAGYFTYGGVFAGTWSGTVHTYGGQYRMTVVQQGDALPALSGVDTGQYNSTPMRLDLVRLIPEQGGQAHTVQLLLEADLSVGYGLNVFRNKYGDVTPVDAIGGTSYWHGLSIATGILAGLIAAGLVFCGIHFIGESLRKRPRTAYC
jgi:hypothetical protein